MQVILFADIIWGEIMKKKILSIGLLICIVIISFSGCVGPNMYLNYPSGKYNSKWATEDGKATFEVGEEGKPIYGVIATENGDVKVELDMSLHSCYIFVVDPDHNADFTDETVLDVWDAVKIEHNHMKVVVFEDEIYKSAFFKKGDVLDFYRVDD